ncbi:hypothetical protein BN439_1928 [Erwinia amylovora Ea644]|uniref:hypothetical protein n=1 Tax=Erwinia amylovora TaxID=552 RepID=UPI0002CB53AA|nr:hypothetical protein [Erwinia amylovora]CCP02988.1 hypothetical protein BN439_1928 [Erwinia amylovora Ea644]
MAAGTASEAFSKVRLITPVTEHTGVHRQPAVELQRYGSALYENLKKFIEPGSICLYFYTVKIRSKNVR